MTCQRNILSANWLSRN